MYKRNKPSFGNLTGIESTVGESIEKKIRRMIINKEPIKDNADVIYTERKDGVVPDYNIRNDKFENAIDAADVVAKREQMRRQADIAERAKKGMEKEKKQKK